MAQDIIRRIRIAAGLILLVSCVLQTGCSTVISSAAGDLADSLSKAVMNNNDPATVEAGGPAYLLMIDSFLDKDPDNESLLITAATLYTAYSDIFVKDESRSRKLTAKAMRYALHAVCKRRPDACSLRGDFHEFENVMASMKKSDTPALFALGAAWAGWIQAHREDMNAIAEISRIEAIMNRVLQLDEFHRRGGAHLYMGVLATFLPPTLGGKPDKGRAHFERALEISEGRNLMAKVAYARHYARMVFDRDLHDRLLEEVLAADPEEPGYVLTNTLAQEQARELLDGAGDFF